MVLWNASHETGGDITRAAEMVKGYRQSVIGARVRSKRPHFGTCRDACGQRRAGR